MQKFYFQYLFLFIAIGSYYPYLGVYLENTLGFTGSQIGIITSIPSMIGVLILPLWGIISDVTKKEKKVLMFNFFITMTMMAVFANTKVFILILLISTVLEMFRNALIPLSDNIAVSYSKTNNKNYGIIRGAGSLGYGLGALLTGEIIKITNIQSIFFYVFIASSLISVLIVPFLDNIEKREEKGNNNIKKDMRKLSKNKGFILILIFSIVTLALTDAVSAYQGMYLMKLGASSSLVGLLTVFMVAPEVFFMAKAKNYIDKYGHSKILILATVSLLLRWVVYITTNNIFIFMIATSLHSVAMAFGMITLFDLIKRNVPQSLNATAMTIYGASVGIGCAAFKLMFGFAMDFIGMKFIFIISIVASLLGFIVINYLKQYTESEELELNSSTL